MISDTVKHLEENIRQAKEIVEQDKALQRLLENKDFRKVIKEGYLENEAIRLVHLKADPAFQTKDRKESLDAQIDAIGHLLQYFRTLSFQANVALKAIEENESMRDELVAEEMTRE